MEKLNEEIRPGSKFDRVRAFGAWESGEAKFAAMARCTEASVSNLKDMIFEGDSIAGKSKAASAKRAAIWEAAIAMFEAGWGNGANVQESGSLWEHVLGTKSQKLAQAALEAGLRPWVPCDDMGRRLAWRHTPIGSAIYKGLSAQSVAMAKAMTKADVALAAKESDALLFDIVDFNVWKRMGPSMAEMFRAWSVAGLEIDARAGGVKGAQTVLMRACEYPSFCEGAIQILLGLGANPKLKRGDGRTALHLACDHDHSYGDDDGQRIQEVRALLKAGADPTARDAEGLAPIDLARASKWRDAIKELEAYEVKDEIDGELEAGARKLGFAVMELRRRGFELVGPDGSTVDWENVERLARSAVSKKKAKGL